MEFLKDALDMVLHIDAHLKDLITNLGPWFYGLMFLIIFCETGLVITPILPGDSLLFALGAFAASGSLDIRIIIPLLIIAAILGDTVNYYVGTWLGPKIFRGEKVRFLNPKYLDRTHDFFEKYGGKTIILARFVPIVRTFAPFVAGMGKMTYTRFMMFNVVGAFVWILLFTIGGYLWGNLPFVKKNFTMVMLMIIVLSCMPAVIEFLREKTKSKRRANI